MAPNEIQGENKLPHVINLPGPETGYFEILGKSNAHVLRSGLVSLPLGRDIGSHSTENCEELIIVLSGHGEIEADGIENKQISAGQTAYNPPNTRHNVTNTGTEPLRYIYVVTKAL